jgi:hypothetical protein
MRGRDVRLDLDLTDERHVVWLKCCIAIWFQHSSTAGVLC